MALRKGKPIGMKLGETTSRQVYVLIRSELLCSGLGFAVSALREASSITPLHGPSSAILCACVSAGSWWAFHRLGVFERRRRLELRCKAIWDFAFEEGRPIDPETKYVPKAPWDEVPLVSPKSASTRTPLLRCRSETRI
jgi:hypothetical protein